MIDPGDALNGLGRYVVTWSLQLVALIGFLWILLQFDRRHRPELRYRLLMLTLVLGLLLPWISLRIGGLWWTTQIKQVWLEPGAATSIAVPKPDSARLQLSTTSVSTAATPDTTRSISATPYMIIGLLWCAGIVIAATRRLQQHRRLAKIVKEASVLPPAHAGYESSLPILLSSEVSIPMLWSYGWLRPVILLPRNIAEWSTAEERATIIRHETIHFHRKDHWVSKLEELIRTILFFHPLARWLCRKLDIERELICDREVLRLGSDPDSYARTLLAVAQHAVATESGVYFAVAAQLSRRIELLFRPYRTARAAMTIVPVTLLMPLAALGFAQARVESLPQIEGGLINRFVPRAPIESPLQAALVPPSTVKPVIAQVTQTPNPAPPEQQTGMRSSVMVLRGQGADNEVRITLGIPYSVLPFLPRISAAGTNFRQASVSVALDITELSGRRVAHQEDPIWVNVLSSSFSEKGIAVYQKGFLLDPGAYNLRVEVTDPATGKITGSLDRRFEISDLPRSALSASSLVIADLIESLPPSSFSRAFAVGDLRVRPNVRNIFRRDEELKIFQQVYPTPNSSTFLEVVITGGGQEPRRISEELAKAPEINVVKRIPLSDFAPGQYEIQTFYSDSTTGRRVGARAQFGVE